MLDLYFVGIDPCLSMAIHNDEIIAIARLRLTWLVVLPLAHFAGFPETASSVRSVSTGPYPCRTGHFSAPGFPTVISSPS